VLAEGDRLPPVRQLASDLGVAAGTVARTYRELEVEGLIATRRGAGTRVRGSPPALPAGRRREALRDHATTFVQQARLLGATGAEIAAVVDQVLRAASPGQDPGAEPGASA